MAVKFSFCRFVQSDWINNDKPESRTVSVKPKYAETKGYETMAITVNIYYTGEKDNARKFAEEMISSGTAAKIKAEEGNLKYDYFFPLEDASTVLLIDSWTDQKALDMHHESPMMQTILELREKYDLHMKVERYISDEEIPESDRKYIKK